MSDIRVDSRVPSPSDARFRSSPPLVVAKRIPVMSRHVPDGEGGAFLAFLWRAHAQSCLRERIRRMQCDQKPKDSALAS